MRLHCRVVTAIACIVSIWIAPLQVGALSKDTPQAKAARDKAQLASEDMVSRALEGQDMIFARRYADAENIFESLMSDYPDSVTGDFGLMASLEIRMLEREDFHLEGRFLKSARECSAKISRLMQRHDPSAWELFMAGSALGIEGFFKARKGQWWDAYAAGTKSRQIFRHVKDIDPSFVDADFGLGMYIYWRSVFSRDLWFLKMFPDRRKEGMEIVRRVAEEGRFSRDLARVNLAVMAIEEKDYPVAEKILTEYVSRYPDNTILKTLLGKVMIALKRYDDAVKNFRAILSVDPGLKKPHYFIGAAYVMSGIPQHFDEAERELADFLSKEGGRYWPASAHYWLGKLAEARGDVARAKAEYEAALKLNPKAIDAQKRMRALGSGV